VTGASGLVGRALCGELLRILSVDALPVGVGMPCSACLAEGLAAERERADRVVIAGVDLPAVHS